MALQMVLYRIYTADGRTDGRTFDTYTAACCAARHSGLEWFKVSA